MSKNPCKGCEKAYIKNGKCYPGWHCTCDKRKLHETYLKKNRKLVEGNTITTLGELVNHDIVFLMGKPKSIEVIKHMQLSTVMGFLERGFIKGTLPNKTED